MTNGEAKFILTAYRPNGRDAADSLFAEALAQARTDPELRKWFAAQLAFDTSISAKLRELQPPDRLRELILAGVRVSSRAGRPRRRHWPWY